MLLNGNGPFCSRIKPSSQRHRKACGDLCQAADILGKSAEISSELPTSSGSLRRFLPSCRRVREVCGNFFRAAGALGKSAEIRSELPASLGSRRRSPPNRRRPWEVCGDSLQFFSQNVWRLENNAYLRSDKLIIHFFNQERRLPWK